MESALEQAKAAVGGNTALAEKLAEIGIAITPQAISQWRLVPVARAADVERVTGVARHLLRPDVWDRPGDRA